MKRIAIFCDGTWQKADRAQPTNVWKLSQATVPSDGRTPQIVYYQEGVGTGRGPTALGRWLDRIIGGAFGLGLNDNIEDAYRWLIFNYEPGDELYVFGYSRGAYTARSLVGLIRSAGIPPDTAVARVGEAMTRYRSHSKETKPDALESFAFRLDLSPEVTTSDEERIWRTENGHPAGVPLTVRYIGVWDTVGSLGVPGQFRLLARLLNGRFQFHDTDLSRCVCRARHAVAIDERRRTFKPTLWCNLDGEGGLNKGDRSPRRPYRQEWFPGDHGSVGGGGRPDLSSIALLWVAIGAAKEGLAFDQSRLREICGARNITAPGRAHARRMSLWYFVTSLGSCDRRGPKDPLHVARATLRRLRLMPGYRPQPLRALFDRLLRR